MPFYGKALVIFQCWDPGDNPYGYRERSCEQSPGLFQHPELWLADFCKLQNHENFMARIPFRNPGSAGLKGVFQQGVLKRLCVCCPPREKTHLWIFHPNIAGVNRHYRALPVTSVSVPTGGRQDSRQPTARGWQATSPLGFSFLPLKAKRERSDCLFLI